MKVIGINRKILLVSSMMLILAGGGGPAFAEQPQPSKMEANQVAAGAEVLVAWDGQKIDRLDYEAALRNNVKEEHRPDFPRDMRRIASLLDDIHVRRELSSRAMAAGIDQDPVVTRQLLLARERMLSTRWLERWESQLAVPDMTAAAEEQYKLKPETYRSPEQVKASHILIGVDKRTEEEALARAEEVLKKARQGIDFSSLVKEYSEDPSAARNEGDLGWFTREKMAKPFSDAAFALERAGDISDVVKTSFGYHVILLQDKKAAKQKTFEDVKTALIRDLEKKWRNEQRAAYIAEIRANKSISLNGPAIDSLLVK